MDLDGFLKELKSLTRDRKELMKVSDNSKRKMHVHGLLITYNGEKILKVENDV